ncbi:tripartite tricarboxylate transporter substrate binding protein [Pusillimonas sp. TS35]|uniref:Bug family tripartite tricarboxylate transporter substrate binding protein n=1 Tax=Paracandidimonas lactea TaxID=2895524 RepID=UPI00136F875D|nr:tripartite tricarboxylate transporter substrate binding protein [Paracandidimonas lactea]MYN13467.1 tripartite tricarboxylate transporter substrate binding protein [Pusillimonas sp. TS35]
MKKLLMGILMAMSVAPTLAAAEYPDRPITFVVPYAPGGTADALARVIAINLGKKLDQSVVVENKSGASGMIGEFYVTRAKADGYTVLYDATPLSINPALHTLNFDPAKDLQPLTMVSVTPNILVVPKSSTFNSIEDVVKTAKEQPGKLTFASGGTGTVQFMAGELFRQGLNLDMLHVPYKSGGPAIMATVAGQVNMMFTNISSSLPLIKDGQVKVLAITSPKRNALLPDTPTVAASGLDGYQVYEWNGMFVPSGTPDAVVSKLQMAIRDVLKEPEVKAKFDSLGADIVASSPEDFAKFLQKEFAKWEDVVRKSGIQKQ